ncbi:MAG: hypothetical protein ACREDX_04240, partial [Aestuariivirga sp.]
MLKLETILLPTSRRSKTINIATTGKSVWPAFAKSLSPAARMWAKAHGFSGEAGKHITIPDASGAVGLVIAGVSEDAGDEPFSLGRLARALPPEIPYEFGEGLPNP